jgi:SAM-dependent methyltransferase
MTEAGTWGADQAESRYALRGGEDAKRRLDLIAGVLQPTTATLLDQVGIEEGSRCLDVGRGGGHVVAELARRVGPGGSVLGLDLDPTVLDLAAQSVDGAGNVAFRQGTRAPSRGEATTSSTRGSCSSTWPTSPTPCGAWPRAGWARWGCGSRSRRS